MEVWKDIEGYEGLYQVSNLGRVRSVDRYVAILYETGKFQIRHNKGTILKQVDNHIRSGYFVVGLSKNGKRKTIPVHRLVAQAFIPNPYNLPCINHKDENSKNNNVDNLEWCTIKYNNNYGTARERTSKKLSKQVYQYTLDGELVKIWDSTREAGRSGFNHSHIAQCCINGYGFKTHKGYIWSYEPIKKEEPKAPPVQLEFDFKD